jgi:RHS repeat-associated protein
LLHSTANSIPPGGTTVAATPNEFLFAGEQFDSDLNLYYNRARYLNVSTGRFWTMDTYDGTIRDPLSLHKYLYSEGDPINHLDASENDVIDFAISTAIDQTLSSISKGPLDAVSTASFREMNGGSCMTEMEPSQPKIGEAHWKRIVRAFYTLTCVLVLVTAVSWVYYVGSLMKTGSSVPNAIQTQPLSEYGATVYITAVEELWLSRLRTLLVLGIPVLVLGGFFLHSVARIKLYGPILDSTTVRLGDRTATRAVRTIYAYAFGLVLVVGALSFCYFVLLMFKGTPVPTALQTESLWSHGRTVYVTLVEKRRLNWLLMFFAAGIPILAIVGLVIHFLAGIKLFSKVTFK